MDILLNNEINKITNEESNEINDFVQELENSLDNPKNKISIDKSFYNEIYNDLKLAPKYNEQLESIIKDCMLDYSYDNEFIYVTYDEKSKQYSMDIYDRDVTKVSTTKKEIEESKVKVGSFYFPSTDWDYLEEAEYIKEKIKHKVDFELNSLERKNEIKNDN